MSDFLIEILLVETQCLRLKPSKSSMIASKKGSENISRPLFYENLEDNPNPKILNDSYFKLSK